MPMALLLHVTRYSIFSNSSIILSGLRASIGVTRSYSSRPFLCALGKSHYRLLGMDTSTYVPILLPYFFDQTLRLLFISFGVAVIRGRQLLLSDIHKPSKIYFAKVLVLQKIW